MCAGKKTFLQTSLVRGINCVLCDKKAPGFLTTAGLKYPTSPLAGTLKVLHAPARREGIRRASQTKINNLGTDEYASNPPFSKNYLAGLISHGTFGGNDGF